MKPNYKNWMPAGMIMSFLTATLLSLVLWIALFSHPVLRIIFFILMVILAVVTLWMYAMYRAFSYNGKRQLSKQIINGTAAYINVPDKGMILDVGCGSGALAIACAKRFPEAKIIGVDRWGKEYASFSQKLCEDNARIEGTENVFFQNGDATKLEFDDETFDAVTSNYVYHNISGVNKQELLLETLRTLKKGGTFAIHDIMSPARYGDMQAFIQKLKDMGYEEVKLIDTTGGMFMTKFESTWMALSGSSLLVGRK